MFTQATRFFGSLPHQLHPSYLWGLKYHMFIERWRWLFYRSLTALLVISKIDLRTSFVPFHKFFLSSIRKSVSSRKFSCYIHCQQFSVNCQKVDDSWFSFWWSVKLKNWVQFLIPGLRFWCRSFRGLSLPFHILQNRIFFISSWLPFHLCSEWMNARLCWSLVCAHLSVMDVLYLFYHP